MWLRGAWGVWTDLAGGEAFSREGRHEATPKQAVALALPIQRTLVPGIFAQPLGGRSDA